MCDFFINVRMRLPLLQRMIVSYFDIYNYFVSIEFFFRCVEFSKMSSMLYFEAFDNFLKFLKRV